MRLLRLPFIAFLFPSSCALGADRVVFDFTGTDPARSQPWTTTSTLETGLTTTGWVTGPGLTLAPASDDRFAFDVDGGGQLTSLDDAVANGHYLSMSIVPAPGTPLNFNHQRITFHIQRDSYHSALRFALMTNIGGFTSGSALIQTQAINHGDQSERSFTYIMPASGYGNITQPIEFRIYPFNALYGGHSLALTGFRIETTSNVYTLTLESASGGTASASPSAQRFESGEIVQLTVNPDNGHKFSGWAGDISGRGNPRTITINQDLTIRPQFIERPPPHMDMGGNLAGLVDWATAWVFKDCFKLSRSWRTQNADRSGAWHTGVAPNVDADGWPLAVPFDPGGGAAPQILHTLVPLYEDGDYTIRFEGTGQIELRPPQGNASNLLNQNGGQHESVLPYQFDYLTDRMLGLAVLQSDPNDPVRNIQVIAPGQDQDLATQPFHPAYLATLSPYRNLRFMDWLKTNNNGLQSWSNRTTRTSATQTRWAGAAHEYIIELCNLLGKDPWICIPAQADDSYVRETARLYRDQLDPSLELYIEYSNETWNSIFTQTTYVQDQGEALGLDTDRWQSGMKYVARRSGEIFEIFETEYGTGERHRLVFVLATQSANPAGVTTPRVAAMNNPAVNPSGIQPDALAIAPYFGTNFSPADLPPNAPAYPTLDELFTAANQSVATERANVAAQRNIADQQGMRLICYEGGQHFIGFLGAENDTTLVQSLFAANRDPRMGQVYQDYLRMLESEGVDLFSNFSHISQWSKWGTWGVLEYQNQPRGEAPKWQAIETWGHQRSSPPNATLLPPNVPQQSVQLDATLRPGRLYQIQWSPDLESWHNVPGNPAVFSQESRQHSWQLPTEGANQRFWRVRVLQ